MCNARLRRNSQWVHVSNDRIVLFWSTHTECECSSEPVPMFLIRRVIVLHHNSRIRDRPTRDCCTLSQRQNGYSVVPEHPHVGPHGPNRASFLMNPMHSIARTRQCPRKSCSPRQPMAAYMWNGLQPVTSFTLIRWMCIRRRRCYTYSMLSPNAGASSDVPIRTQMMSCFQTR